MGSLKFIWNIPNTLSLVRLALLPVFAVLYLKDHFGWSLLALALSGLPDLFDGMIARKYHQITDIGKLLDPFADKLTQIVVLVCLTIRNPRLTILVVICFTKELLQAIGGWILFSRKEIIRSSKWFGKLSTFTFYIAMLAIALWSEMPSWLMMTLIGLVAATMVFSFFMYLSVYFQIRRENGLSKKKSAREPVE